MRQRKMLPALLAGALVLSACAAAAPAPTAAPETVPTMVLPTVAPAGGGSAAAPEATAPASAIQPSGATTIDLGVTASGEVVARQAAELSFRVPGVVAEILVDEGDNVEAGQELVRLDAAELQLALRQAEAGLAQARSGYDRLVEGATPEEVAAAEAQLAQAQAALRQARGSVTEEDIAAAEAALQSALARQAEIAAGPKATDLQQAQAGVDAARANLELQRANLSAAKTNAQLRAEQAANQLRDAQDAYSQIYWNNRNLEKFPGPLPQELIDREAAALRAVESAEAALGQAQVGYDQARQAEIEGIQAAEAQLRQAEAQLQKLLDGATAEQRAAVDAQVAQARANLDKLRGDQRAGGIQAAEAGVAAARANLGRVTSDPTEATLAGALAQVQQAEAAVESARLNLEKATLRAPFAGVVAQINVDIGDLAGSGGQPAVQIVDVSELRVEANVSDTDVARVREGMPATVTVDAIPGATFTGTVSYIAPTATVIGTIRTYPVRITLDAQDAGLRAGMSVRVAIQVEG
ncbi:MAG: efflux RND transporter periplasmic adaptor subunit [Chloroflexi bacterium OHK40]